MCDWHNCSEFFYLKTGSFPMEEKSTIVDTPEGEKSYCSEHIRYIPESYPRLPSLFGGRYDECENHYSFASKGMSYYGRVMYNRFWLFNFWLFNSEYKAPAVVGSTEIPSGFPEKLTEAQALMFARMILFEDSRIKIKPTGGIKLGTSEDVLLKQRD